jgi:hypothetical protein
LFFLLLDQMNLLFRELRVIIIGAFGLIMCLPMIFTFLPPKPSPVVYPPYLPPLIQQTGSWMKENELMMSDMPWAVAWYAQRQCLWLTLDADAEFFAVNDFLKPVHALYLTPETMDNRFLTQWWRAANKFKGQLLLSTWLSTTNPDQNCCAMQRPGVFGTFVSPDGERWRRRQAPPAQPDGQALFGGQSRPGMAFCERFFFAFWRRALT